MAFNGFHWVYLLLKRISRNWLLLSWFCVDTKKDLRMITMRLLDMLVSKDVSGQGRDRALNLLNKNIPRKDLKDHDNSRTIFVIDNGESFLSTLFWLGRCGAAYSCLNTCRNDPLYEINPLWLFCCCCSCKPRAKLDLAGNSIEIKRKKLCMRTRIFQFLKD